MSDIAIPEDRCLRGNHIEPEFFARLTKNITNSRHQEEIDVELVKALLSILAWGRRIPKIQLYRVIHHQDNRLLSLSVSTDGTEVKSHHDQEMQLQKQHPGLQRAMKDRITVSEDRDYGNGTLEHQSWVPVDYKGELIACVEITVRRPLQVQAEQMALVDCLLAVYCNYLALLEYSQVDALTGLLNRNTFEDSLTQLLSGETSSPMMPPGSERRHLSKQTSAGHWLAVIDIDDFKQVNDIFGHLVGDDVLVRVSDIMRSVFRRHDRLFRFGGEEFVVLLRGVTRQNAMRTFRRFCSTVAKNHIDNIDGHITVSVGLSRACDNDTPTEWLGRSDNALYYAKQNGKNQVANYEQLIEANLVSKPAVWKPSAKTSLSSKAR